MGPLQVKADTFVKLLQPLQKPLEVYCRRMLRSRFLIEDVIQSAVADAYGQFDAFIPGSNFKAWIFRFVTFTIFNRNRKREPETVAELPDVAADLSIDECWNRIVHEDVFAALLDDPDVVLEHFDDVVVDILQQLPPLERAVLLLHAVGEFNYKEVHELLSIPLGSVIGYLSRARKRLRLSLADYAAAHGLFPQKPSSREPEP